MPRPVKSQGLIVSNSGTTHASPTTAARPIFRVQVLAFSTFSEFLWKRPSLWQVAPSLGPLIRFFAAETPAFRHGEEPRLRESKKTSNAECGIEYIFIPHSAFRILVSPPSTVAVG